MYNNGLFRKLVMIIMVAFMLVGNMSINVRAEDDYSSQEETVETQEGTAEETVEEKEDEVVEEVTEETPETTEITEEEETPVEEDTKQEEGEPEQEEEILEEETEEEKEVDPGKQYEYRLIVGFASEVNTREEDVVLGTFDTVVLLGFDSVDELDEAKQYYTDNAMFASVDGILSVADNESSSMDVDTAQSSASETASMDENPLSEASETSVAPVNASSVVALVDTGAAGNNVVKQLSVLGEDVNDNNGHGTSLAELMGELNPETKIISIKALNENGTGTVASVYAAIKLAIDSNVDYILCPFSALGYSEAIKNIIVEATNKGIKVVVSAGNDGNSATNYCPANVEEAITVGALNLQDEIAEFSNKGSMVDAWVFATSTSEAAAILTSYLTLGNPLEYYTRSFANDFDDQLPNPVDGDNVEFSTTYKETTDGLVDGGIYIIRLRKAPAKALVQLTSAYENGNKFVLSNGDKLEGSGAQFRLVKINYNYYFQVRDNTNYIMSPEGGANNLSSNGTKVHMWKKATSDYKDFDQWWMKANGNYYRITNGANTGMHLQTEGANTSGSTYTHLWNATSGTQGDWIFERVWYNVQFNPNGGSGSAYTQKFWQEESKALTANKFTRTGYTFNGWNTKNSGTGTNYSAGQSVKTLTSTNAATYNLYAKWKANTYSVAYNGNGATSGSMSSSSHTYDTAKNLTANAFTRTGYTFAGWNTKSDGTGTNYSNSQSVKNLATSGTVTLYAKWTPNTYTVAYNGNGSTGGSTASSSHTYDTAKNLTANGFSRTGYTFAGWNTKSDGTGTNYSNQQSVTNLASSGTVTLYAKWTPITYTVSYNGNGSTGGSTASSTHTYNTAKALTANGFSRTGYTFNNWNSKADGTGTSYSNSQSVTNLSSTNNAAITLYAQWTANTYTVVYNGNGSTGGSTSSSSHVYNTAKTLTANGFTKTGYSFDKWNSNNAGTGTSYVDKESVKNLTATAGGTYNLYVIWKANEYALTLDSHNATSTGTTAVYYTYDTAAYYSDEAQETSITKIELPERTGYDFGGYYSQPNGAGTQYIDVNGGFVNDPYKLTGATLYAKWTAKTYTVAFDPNGGELASDTENPHNATYDEHMTVHHPIYEGYTFKGWNIDGMEEGITHEFGSNTSTSDKADNIDATTFKNLRGSEGTVDFVAQWQANTYKVLFDSDGGDLDPSTSNPLTATYDVEFSVKSPTKEGHVFHGWQIDGMHGSKHIIDGVETSDINYTLETDKDEVTFNNLRSHGGEVELIALWAEKEYTVKYLLNGGSLDGIKDKQEKVYGYDHTFTVLNPTREGYTFDGWRVTGMNAGTSHLVGGEETTASEVGGVKGVSFGRLNMNGGTVTLEATWESDDIVVILSAPEANPEPDYTRRIYYTFEINEYFADPDHKTPLAEPISVPERDNYIFTGFYDSSDGTGLAIIDEEGEIHADLSKIYPAPHNLYVGWNPVIYEIELSQDDATTTGTEVIYEKYNTGIYMDSDATKLVDKIVAPVKEVTVSFDGNGVTDPADVNVPLQFEGYYDDETALIGPAGQLLPAFVGTYFESNSAIEARFSTGTVKLPAPADREGYSFDGWYNGETRVGGADDSYVVSEDTQLTAKWVEDPALKYDKNATDASGEVADATAKEGKVITIAENSYVRKGYTFKNWNTKADGTGATYNAGTSTVWNEELIGDSYTLYAQWESKKLASIQEIDDQPFTGEAITTTITVIDNNGDVVDSSEYTLSWLDNIEVGTAATVTATPKDDGNYKASDPISTTFKIVKAPYSQFNEKKVNYSGVYDGNDHVVMVTSNTEDDYHAYKIGYGLTEQEAEENARAASLSPVNVGHKVNKVSDSGTIYYYIIPENFEEYSGTLTANITPKEITVTGISAQSRVYDGTTDVTLTGTAALSGVVAGDTVTFDDSGVTAVATNKNAGNQGVVVSGYAIDGADKDNYVLVQPDELKITINKKPVSFTWADASYTYDGNAKEYKGATVSAADVISGDRVEIASYSGNVKTDADDYTATVVALSGDDSVNYSVGDNASHAWSIVKADNTVVVSMNDWTYGKQESDPTITATYGKENVVYQYSADGEVYSDTKPSVAGDYYIKATIPAGDNYNECSATDRFTIEKAEIKVKANDATSVRNAALVENIGFEVSGDFVAADRSSLEALIAVTTNADKTKAGKYKTTAAYETSAVSANYNIKFEEGVYTVTRNKSTVTAQGYNGTYDGNNHGISVTVTDDDQAIVYYSSTDPDPVVEAALDDVHANYDADDAVFIPCYEALVNALENSNDWSTVSPTTFKDVNNYNVRYIVVTNQSVPDAIEGSEEVVINKASLTVTAKNNTITYGDEPAAKGVKYAGFISGEGESVLSGTLSYDFAYAQFKDAGTYAITPKGLSSDNYDIIYKDGVLTVGPLAVELTWSPSETEFTHNGNTYTVTAAVSNAINSDDVSVATYTNNVKSAEGEYTAEATSLAGSKSNNYTLTNGTNLTYDWSIVNKDNNVSVTLEDWTYGDNPNTPVVIADYNQKTATFEYFTKNGEDYTKLSGVPSEVGTYYVVATVPSDGYYLEGKSDYTAFNIDKKDINILIDNKVSKYGNDLLPLTYKLSDSLVGSDDLKIVLSTVATKDSAAGDYDITATYDTENNNYNVTVSKGTYTISKAPIKATISGYTGEYDGEEHSITVTINPVSAKERTSIYYAIEELTKDNFNEKGSLDPITRTDAGTTKVYYYITSQYYDSDPTVGSQDIVITKKALTVKANDNEVDYGQDPSDAGVTYEGLIAGDESKIGDIKLTYTNYEKGSNVGNYDIVPSGLTTENYEVTYINGTLTVNPIVAGFTWDKASFNYNGEAQSPKASIANKFGSDDVEVDTYSGNVQTVVGSYVAQALTLKGEKAGNYKISSSEASTNHNWKIVQVDNYWVEEPEIEGWTYSKESNDPSATPKFGGPVIFEYKKVGEEDRFYVSNKPTQVGSYILRATVIRDDNFRQLSATVEFEITPAEVTVLIDDKTAPYRSTVKDLTYELDDKTIDKSELGVVLSTTATLLSPVGNYDITATWNNNPNYDVTINKGTYSITKANLRVSASSYEGTYDGQDHGINVVITEPELNDATIWYSTQEITAENFDTVTKTDDPLDSSVTQVNVGTKTVYYFVKSENFDADPEDPSSSISGSKTVTIKKHALTISVNDQHITYGDLANAGKPKDASEGISYTIPTGCEDDIVFGQIHYDYDYEQYGKVGTYDITVTAESVKTNNYNITFEKGNLIVSPRPITFTWVDENGEAEFAYDYDGSTHHVVATPVTINEDTFTGELSYENNNASEVGEYDAKVTHLPDEEVANNYVLEKDEPTATQPWDINMATNTWETEPTIEGWTYGEAANVPTAKAKFGDTSKRYYYRPATSSDWNEEVPTKAGEYEMKIVVDGTENYSGIESEVEFSIEKAKITVTANDHSSEYLDDLHELTYSVGGAYVDGDELAVELTTDATSTSQVNEYEIKAEVNNKDALNNYEIEYIFGTYTITRKALTISVEGYTGTYDGKPHGIKARITDPDVHDATIWFATSPITEENFDEIERTPDPNSSEVTRTNAGKTTIYYYIDSKNYSILSGSETIDIGKAKLTIAANDYELLFGDAPGSRITTEAGGSGVGYAGFVEGEDESNLTGKVKLSTPYKQFDDVKEEGYVITPSGATSDNYDIEYVEGKLTINPIDISKAIVEVVDVTYKYEEGKEYTPEVKVTLHAKDENNESVHYPLVKGKDYDLSGDTTSGKFGIHHIIVNGKGNFNSNSSHDWQINNDEPKKDVFDDGKIEVETDIFTNGENINISVDDLTEEVAKSMLTEDDLADIESGEVDKAIVYLEINVIDNLPEEDKYHTLDKIDELAAKPCLYIDITIWKRLGKKGTLEEVTELQKKQEVTITIEVPEEFHNKNRDVERNFYVIRTHEGEVEVLAGPTTSTTLTFKSGLFSSYTIAYRDRFIDKKYSLPKTGIEG